MANIVNYHLVLPDFVHYQITPYWKSTESGFPRCFAQVRRFGTRYRLLNASDEVPRGFWVVACNIGKNLIEIGESATFVPNPHALR
jgi:hypothetical protein